MHEKPSSGFDGRRLLVNLLWGLIQVAIVCVLFFGGLAAVGYLELDVINGFGGNGLFNFGWMAGVIIALAVNHSARGWLQHLRLRGLRARGVAAEASVTSRRTVTTSGGRGTHLTVYTVRVRWKDPEIGLTRHGERKYRFWGRGSRRFEAACVSGAAVPVYYPPGRPRRFVIDIPFAPTMADLFL